MSENEYKEKYLNELKKVNGIEVRAIPERNYITSGVLYELPVLFQVLVGSLPENCPRPPVNLCLVLDRSGSMDGEPIKNCKKAIIQLIEKLQDDDIVHLVIYDDKVETIFENKRKSDLDTLLPKIEAIRARGMTNISQGLETAVSVLNKNQETVGERIVFLFSDGLANQGIKDLNTLGESKINPWVSEGISFSSFGIGQGYDEKWLRAIARSGHGNYFYIDTMERIPEVVEKGLRGFATVVAKDLRLRIRGKGQHQLFSIGDSEDYQTLIEGKRIGQLREHGLVQFLAYLRIGQLLPDAAASGAASSGWFSGGGSIQSSTAQEELMEYSLEWDWVREGFLPSSFGSNITGTIQLPQSNDVSQLMETNHDVDCYQAIVEGGKLNVEINEYLKNRDASKAIKGKEEVLRIYREVVDMDRFGIIPTLIEKEAKALEMLRKEGVSEAAAKYQYVCSAVACKAACADDREDWEEDEEGSDEDMGFGLFD